MLVLQQLQHRGSMACMPRLQWCKSLRSGCSRLPTCDVHTPVAAASQNALKLMSKQKSGRIVNITSVVGVVGNAGQVCVGGWVGVGVCGCVWVCVPTCW